MLSVHKFMAIAVMCTSLAGTGAAVAPATAAAEPSVAQDISMHYERHSLDNDGLHVNMTFVGKVIPEGPKKYRITGRLATTECSAAEYIKLKYAGHSRGWSRFTIPCVAPEGGVNSADVDVTGDRNSNEPVVMELVVHMTILGEFHQDHWRCVIGPEPYKNLSEGCVFNPR